MNASTANLLRCGRVKRPREQLLLLSCLALCLALPGYGAPPRVDARAYYDRYVSNLGAIEAEIDSIVPAAEAAAKLYVGGRNLGVRGGAGLREELGGRSGGLMPYHAERGNAGDIMIYAFGVRTSRKTGLADSLDKELADAETLAAGGSLVIGIASLEQLEKLGRLDRARSICAFLLDNRAGPTDGMATDGQGRPLLSTFVTANPVVLWVWQAEFFAACTRLGKTPTMWQSIAVDRDLKRAKRYKKVRFHEDQQVHPIKPGRLGRAYLHELRRVLEDIADKSWPALMQTALRAAEVLRGGGRVQVLAQGHYPPHHHRGGYATDPGHLSELSKPGKADFAIALGYCAPPGHPRWARLDELRGAGQGVAWITSGYMNRNQEFLRDNEIFLDQQWAEGDALVAVEGYDVRICPPSGIAAEVIMWMVKAQVYRELKGVPENARMRKVSDEGVRGPPEADRSPLFDSPLGPRPSSSTPGGDAM